MGWREVVVAAGGAPFVYLWLLERLGRLRGAEAASESMPAYALVPAALLFAVTLCLYIALTLFGGRSKGRANPRDRATPAPGRELAITEFALHLDRRRIVDLQLAGRSRHERLSALRSQLAALPSSLRQGSGEGDRDLPSPSS
jgi:hypothetical protein